MGLYEKTKSTLIGVPEYDGENESKLENTLQVIIQENFPNPTRQPRNTENTTKILLKKSNPKANNHLPGLKTRKKC